MTPSEAARLAEAHDEERTREAWMHAALVRSKRLPSLDHLLNRGMQARELTEEEIEEEQQALKDSGLW